MLMMRELGGGVGSCLRSEIAASSKKDIITPGNRPCLHFLYCACRVYAFSIRVDIQLEIIRAVVHHPQAQEEGGHKRASS